VKITDGHITYGIITPILFFFLGWALLSFVFPEAFAESSVFEEPVLSVFDWMDDAFSESIDSAGIENRTKTNLHNTLDAGIDAGKTGTSLWFKIHAFLKELIFSGANEAGYDESTKDLIGIIAILAVFAMVIGLLKHLFRENAKILMIVVAILFAMGVTGIMIEF